MFYRNLEDVIPSVRAGAATALAGVAKARDPATLENIMARLLDGLKAVAKQPKDLPDQTESKQARKFHSNLTAILNLFYHSRE